ncbi:MAG: recombinase family protein [Streptococcaceae bacterium]|jgi:DNA invertase Pin-like site-specific DNA recombinase|nr:recombinase family protein [Streptococcaceae bacterium]
MIYGYARVSTKGQDLSVQLSELKKAGASKIFAEKFTGRTLNRPEFQKLCECLTSNDTVMVTKLDRFARNTREALNTLEPLLEKGVKVYVLNLGLIENSVLGKFFLRTLLSVAEMERDMILERTQEGKIWAKMNKPDYKEGRPLKLTPDVINKIGKLRAQGWTIQKVANYLKISDSSVKRGWRKYMTSPPCEN